MNKVFAWLRNLRKYYSLNVAVCITSIHFFIILVELNPFLSKYLDGINNYVFDLHFVAMVSIFLFPFEVVVRYVIDKSSDIMSFIADKIMSDFGNKDKIIKYIDNTYTAVFVFFILLNFYLFFTWD